MGKQTEKSSLIIKGVAAEIERLNNIPPNMLNSLVIEQINDRARTDALLTIMQSTAVIADAMTPEETTPDIKEKLQDLWDIYMTFLDQTDYIPVGLSEFFAEFVVLCHSVGIDVKESE